MIICKSSISKIPIITIDEWKKQCPPQGKNKQWKDGRSAKETAKNWIKGVPVEFSNTTKTLSVIPSIVLPEFNSKFDDYKGGVRNHDLLILDDVNKIVVGIESKVDEPFSNNLQNQILLSEIKFQNNPKSKALQRIEDLRKALFGKLEDVQLNLKYQLLTSVAGTIAEAKNRDCKKAVFLVQTFLSQEMDSKKHRQNQRDLDYFVEIISKGKYKIIHDGDLLHIGTLPVNSFIPDDVELYIGKYSIKL